jgi:DNA-binding MarR family transcriptional regulator
MKPDPTIVAAIRAAVENDPENVALRLHLAKLLLEGAEPAAALAECARVLAAAPEHITALDLAATAAEATGATKRAIAYRTMSRMLGSQSAAEPPSPAPPPAPSPIASSGASDSSPEKNTHRPNREAPVRLDVIRGGRDEREDDGELPAVRLADVAGLDKVKRRLHAAFLGPMQNPALLRAYGKSLRGGLLLYGPPGCGKTFIARAVAGELPRTPRGRPGHPRPTPSARGYADARTRGAGTRRALRHRMYDVASELKRAHLRAVAAARSRMAPLGLTPARFDLLYVVHRACRPLRQREITRALGVTAVTVSRMLVRLEQLGLVTRAAESVDRRAKAVRLTPEGARRVGRAIRAIDGATSFDLAPA